MKKKIIILSIMLLCLTGCSFNLSLNGNNNGNNEPTTTAKTLDHKVYKYVKMKSSSADDFYTNINYIFGWIDTVGYGANDYIPTLIVETDPNTGKAIKSSIYGYFLDLEDNKWVNEAYNKYESSSDSYKKDIINVSKGRINDEVSFIKIDINPESYRFEQYISSYIMREQNIEKYKNETYYDNLYNYTDPTPAEVGDNYFVNGLTKMRLEWSDNELKPDFEGE